MEPFKIPKEQFTLKELAEANPDAETSEVRRWFAYQIAEGKIEIVDGQNGIFKRNRNGGSPERKVN